MREQASGSMLWMGVVAESFFIFRKHYRVEDMSCSPNPWQNPPVIYAVANLPPQRTDCRESRCVSDARRSPNEWRKNPRPQPAPGEIQKEPMKFGIAGYAMSRDGEEAQDELQRITDVQQSAAGYAIIRSGLRGLSWNSGFRLRIIPFPIVVCGLACGTPEQVQEKIAAFEAVGWNCCCCNLAANGRDGIFSKAVIHKS